MQGSKNPDTYDHLLEPSTSEPNSSEVPKDRRGLAIMFANGYALLSSIYFSGLKMLQLNGVRFLEIATVRFIIAVAIAYGVVKAYGKGIFSDITTFPHKRDIIIRSLLGIISFNMAIVVVTMVPLAIFSIIQNTSGFWSSILGYFFFGDRLHWKEIVGLIMGYCGITMIILGKKDVDTESDMASLFYIGIALCILQSFLQASIQVLTRSLRGVHYSVVQLNYSLFGVVIMSFILLMEFFISGMEWKADYTLKQWLLLIFFCICNGVGVLLFTGAFQMEKAGAVTIVTYVAVLYNFVIDVTIFDYTFSVVQIAGALLILSVNVYIGILKIQKKL